jgi:heme exporter protein A
MLEINHLDFDYHDINLLQNVHFSVQACGMVHLKGENGAGKATLLRLISGIFEPSSGSIDFNGQNINFDLPSYQKNLCYVGHKSGLNPHLTVMESLLFGLSKPASTADISSLLNTFHLKHLADAFCGQLSQGQQRRVSLMRLLVSKALIWLLDEPFVALDEKSMHQLIGAIRKHRASGGYVILTSHQPLPEEIGLYEEYVL